MRDGYTSHYAFSALIDQLFDILLVFDILVVFLQLWITDNQSSLIQSLEKKNWGTNNSSLRRSLICLNSSPCSLCFFLLQCRPWQTLHWHYHSFIAIFNPLPLPMHLRTFSLGCASNKHLHFPSTNVWYRWWQRKEHFLFKLFLHRGLGTHHPHDRVLFLYQGILSI